MYDKEAELQRLIRLLRSIGRESDYPAVREEANFLFHSIYSWEFGPVEARRGVFEHLEQLPSFLNGLKDRARREDKKESYERLIAKMEKEIDLFTLLAVWKNWDRSKERVCSLAKEVFLVERQAKAWNFLLGERGDGYSEFSPMIFGEPDESTAAGRFEVKVQEILPKPRITSEDYEVLLQELEDALDGWREVAVAPEEREYADGLILGAEGWITELYVLSLLDS